MSLLLLEPISREKEASTAKCNYKVKFQYIWRWTVWEWLLVQHDIDGSYAVDVVSCILSKAFFVNLLSILSYFWYLLLVSYSTQTTGTDVQYAGFQAMGSI